MRASGGIAEPHWVQKPAGGVERWQVGHRISPGFGVAMSRALCPSRAVRARDASAPYIPSSMRRINVVGSSNAGKTTLARAVSQRLGVPHVELDALYWGPRWTPVGTAEFRRRVTDALAADAWVADGGYQVARDITWGRADTIVWLDYPLRVVLRRWARRTLRRIRTGEEFWPGTGNRESLWNAIRPSGLLWWILRTHRGKRRRTEARLAARPDLRLVRLRSPRAARRWLASL
jgi:hypothetical protein